MPTSSDGGEPAAPAAPWFDPLAAPGPRLHPGPRDSGEFPAWRERVLAAVRGRIRCAAPAGLPAPALLASRYGDGLVREEYLLTSKHTQAAGTLLAPAHADGKLPAVLVCPGRNAVVAQVTGAQPADYPDRAIAARLCAAGFVTFTLDYRFGGRVDPGRVPGRDEAAVLAQLYQVAGRSLLGELAAAAAAALAWLASHPAVEPGQVALFGHSLGGAVALHTALAQPVPPPLCVASHLGSYRILGYGHPASLLPGIAAEADLPGLYAALAPAPLHLQYGLTDTELDPADAAAAGDEITRLYRLAGADGRAEVLAAPMGHGTATGPAIGFLRRALCVHPSCTPA
jgi:perosamine synthetase